MMTVVVSDKMWLSLKSSDYETIIKIYLHSPRWCIFVLAIAKVPDEYGIQNALRNSTWYLVPPVLLKAKDVNKNRIIYMPEYTV